MIYLEPHRSSHPSTWKILGLKDKSHFPHLPACWAQRDANTAVCVWGNIASSTLVPLPPGCSVTKSWHTLRATKEKPGFGRKNPNCTWLSSSRALHPQHPSSKRTCAICSEGEQLTQGQSPLLCSWVWFPWVGGGLGRLYEGWDWSRSWDRAVVAWQPCFVMHRGSLLQVNCSFKKFRVWHQLVWFFFLSFNV